MPLPPITRPSPAEVQKYLAKWRAGNSEPTAAALSRLFREDMPHNTDVGEVAVKVAALNGIYSTRIFGVVQVAQHIVDSRIDDRLAQAAVDAQLIETVAAVTLKGKTRRNYSFATKYCSFHRPDLYPIYDNLVHRLLNAMLRQGEVFDTFAPGERWASDYSVWNRSILKFRSHFGLQQFPLRDIDKYLWQLAKERESLAANAP